MSDVALSAALRSNLLSLQSTQSSIDKVQLALSTGRTVNSTLDNPQNFFTSQTLSNRANDLNRLLDGMGQSIQTLKETDTGVSGLSDLVEQADSIATSARDELNSGNNSSAKIVGDRDLSGVDDVTSLTGLQDADTFDITLVDSDGNSDTQTITINSGDSAQLLAQEINDVDFATTVDADIEARITEEGYLEITSTNASNFRLENLSLGGGATESANLQGASALGIGDFFGDRDPDNAAATDIVATAISGVAITSVALVETADGSVAERSDTLQGLEDENGNAFTLAAGANDSNLVITTDEGSVTVTLDDTTTIQSLIDDINAGTTGLAASYDEATGEISIRSTSSAVTQVTIENEVQNGSPDTVFGFGTGASDTTGGTDGGDVVNLGAAAGRLAQLESDFNEIRSQIDTLVEDANYRGTNLLKGDNLVTDFNEDGSSGLTTEGVNFTSSGLGINEANFSSLSAASTTISEISAAQTEVRTFGESIANDLSVIQIREDFTKETINVLEEGSDKLTLADQNEEGAKLLALQTRQQLGITALSLASQSQQSVLRLF